MRRPTEALSGDRSQAGFTIIEVIVTIMLLSVIVLVVLTPLTGFFGLTRRSNQQVDATQLTQRALETIRGEWQNVGRYDQACLKSPLPETSPPLQVEVTNLGPNGAELGPASWRADCAAGPPLSPADTSPLRRVQVTRLDASGRVLSQLTVLVDRP